MIMVSIPKRRLDEAFKAAEFEISQAMRNSEMIAVRDQCLAALANLKETLEESLIQ